MLNENEIWQFAFQGENKSNSGHPNGESTFKKIIVIKFSICARKCTKPSYFKQRVRRILKKLPTENKVVDSCRITKLKIH